MSEVKSQNNRKTLLKVLIIGEYFPPDLGGAATRASNAARGLTLNGCNVTVVTAFPHYPTGKIPQEYKYKPLMVEYVGKTRVIRTFVLPFESKGLFKRTLIFLSFMLSSLIALPFTGKIDVIWAANPDVFVLVPAHVYSVIRRKPIVSNTDDLIIEDLYDLNLVKKGSLFSLLVEFLSKTLYRHVKADTPISPGYVNPIHTNYLMDRNRIHVVRGGVDLSLFVINRAKSRNDEQFTVLYVGVLGVGYDFDQIISAAEIVAEKDKDIHFVLHGGGESTQHLKDAIKLRKLSNLTLSDKIFKSRKEVVDLMNKANVLILPMKDFGRPYRGIATKLYEYQAMGKPIICCGDGEPAKHVSKTNSGLIVKPGDHTAIADAILYLKKNPEVARKLGSNGRKYVENEASIEAIGLNLKTFLEKIIE